MSTVSTGRESPFRIPPSPVALTDDEEERARRLHEESIIFFCHDHLVHREDVVRMADGGASAKQLHLCLDARVWCETEVFLATAQDRGIAREFALKGLVLEPTTLTPEQAHLGLQETFTVSALVAFDYLHWLVDSSGGLITLALEPGDIRRAKERNGIALLLGSEGARMLSERVEVLRMLYRLGLRHLQLSWALDNSIGTPQTDTSGEGLTEFGREVIVEMNRLGMIVDVSHLSYSSIAEALEISETPILNSHTGALALNSLQPQLLPDELIRATAAQGGVLGIHFMSQMVKPGDEKARFDHLMRQFTYIAELVGPEHLACGPDYLPQNDPRIWEHQHSRPFSFAEGVEDVDCMFNVTRGLVKHGFSDEEIRGIMGGNLLRVFEAVHSARAPYTPTRYDVPAELGTLSQGTTPL
jgi:membrane dipeptidase